MWRLRWVNPAPPPNAATVGIAEAGGAAGGVVALPVLPLPLTIRGSPARPRRGLPEIRSEPASAAGPATDRPVNEVVPATDHLGNPAVRTTEVVPVNGAEQVSEAAQANAE